MTRPLDEASEVARRRRGCHLGFDGQRGGGERPTVRQRHEHGRPGRPAHECSHRGDVGVPGHTLTLPSAHFGLPQNIGIPPWPPVRHGSQRPGVDPPRRPVDDLAAGCHLRRLLHGHLGHDGGQRRPARPVPRSAHLDHRVAVGRRWLQPGVRRPAALRWSPRRPPRRQGGLLHRPRGLHALLGRHRHNHLDGDAYRSARRRASVRHLPCPPPSLSSRRSTPTSERGGAPLASGAASQVSRPVPGPSSGERSSRRPGGAACSS